MSKSAQGRRSGSPFDGEPPHVHADAKMLIRESNHRIKNHLQMVAALLGLQARDNIPGEVRTALFDAQSRVMAIARLHERLQEAEFYVEVSDFLAGLCSDFRHVFDAGAVRGLRFELEAAPLTLPSDRAAALGLAVNELVTNAVKHAYAERGGEIRICLRPSFPGWRLTVSDDGPGVAARPAGVDQRAGLGLVGQMVRTLRGNLVVDDTEQGASISIWFA